MIYVVETGVQMQSRSLPDLHRARGRGKPESSSQGGWLLLRQRPRRGWQIGNSAPPRLVAFSRDSLQENTQSFIPHIAIQDSLGKLIHYLQPRIDKVTLQIHVSA